VRHSKRPKKGGSKKAEIGARLRALRKERGMTQAELAAAVGTHFANISQVERGIRGLGIEQAMKLCAALGVSSERLLRPDAPIAKPLPLRVSRLLRRFERVQELPAEDQRTLLRFLNSLLQSRGLPTATPLRRAKHAHS
jgi:transcriptional regulator with XRE-family HTH domain